MALAVLLSSHTLSGKDMDKATEVMEFKPVPPPFHPTSPNPTTHLSTTDCSKSVLLLWFLNDTCYYVGVCMVLNKMVT